MTPKDVFKSCGSSSGIKLGRNMFDKQSNHVIDIRAILIAIFKKNDSYEKADCMRTVVKISISNPLLLCLFIYQELLFL